MATRRPNSLLVEKRAPINVFSRINGKTLALTNWPTLKAVLSKKTFMAFAWMQTQVVLQPRSSQQRHGRTALAILALI